MTTIPLVQNHKKCTSKTPQKHLTKIFTNVNIAKILTVDPVV